MFAKKKVAKKPEVVEPQEVTEVEEVRNDQVGEPEKPKAIEEIKDSTPESGTEEELTEEVVRNSLVGLAQENQALRQEIENIKYHLRIDF